MGSDRRHWRLPQGEIIRLTEQRTIALIDGELIEVTPYRHGGILGVGDWVVLRGPGVVDPIARPRWAHPKRVPIGFRLPNGLIAPDRR